MSNIKDLVLELQNINNNDITAIKIPSTGKICKFKSITVKQHKDIIKCALDGIEGSIRLNSIFNSIIKENSVEPVSFKLSDRNYILVQLRKANVGPIIKIDNIEYDLNELPSNVTISTDKSNTLSYQNITVTVEIPTLDFENQVIERCLAEIVKTKNETKQENDYITTLLTYEMIKFVDTIKIDDTLIDLNQYNISERKSILDNIPLKLNNDIIEYIASYKGVEQKNFCFNENIELTIDASFLTND
jgi:hypothetical protein